MDQIYGVGEEEKLGREMRGKSWMETQGHVTLLGLLTAFLSTFFPLPLVPSPSFSLFVWFRMLTAAWHHRSQISI